MASPRNLISSNSAAAWELRAGAFVPNPAVSLEDRGFRYGLGLFETVRVREGRAELLSAHWSRLTLDAARFGFPPLPEFDLFALNRLIPDGFTGVLRIYWSAGEGAPSSPWHAGEGRLYLTLTPREFSSAPQECSLCIASEAIAPIGAKTLNYWQHLAAHQAALRQGFGETLLWAWQPRAETARRVAVSVALGNLFWIVGGRLQTPEFGARRGVVREWVLQNLDVEFSDSPPAHVAEAEMIFVTNSWVGLLPVTRIGGRKLSVTSEFMAWREAFEQASRASGVSAEG